uniref:Uncharacterized protein n=1 Tax=Rhizophora mucronata TaxID=61149 RepID=A0A2P2JRM1_RHIMU
MWSQRSLETVPCFNIYYKRTTVRSETNSLVVKPKTIAQPPMALKWTDITWHVIRARACVSVRRERAKPCELEN